jgi:hypothetical protein
VGGGKALGEKGHAEGALTSGDVTRGGGGEEGVAVGGSVQVGGGDVAPSADEGGVTS